MAANRPKASRLPLVVAVIALLLAAGVGFTYYQESTRIASLQNQVSSLQTSQVIDTSPQTRNLTLQWETFGTGQDRFYPSSVVVDQGDTVDLTFINNDTVYAHTFTIYIPTSACPSEPGGCEYQINASAAGLASPLTQEVFSGDASNCVVADGPVPCSNMVTGTPGNVTGILSFTVVQPGVFEYYCAYSQSVGMYGYLVVLPNAGYTP